MDTINGLRRNVDKMTENINSGPINFRTFAPRRDPFNDKEKPTPPPITKSCESQGLAAGEKAVIEIMKNDLKTSKDIIEYLKK